MTPDEPEPEPTAPDDEPAMPHERERPTAPDGEGATSPERGGPTVPDAEVAPEKQTTPARDEPVVEPEYVCDLCGAPMIELHCKLLCRRCGYNRDCSDP